MPLEQYSDVFGHVAAYLWQQQRIVCAAEYQCVDIGRQAEQRVEVFAHEVVGSVAVGFAVFDEGYPHGACVRVDAEAGQQLGHLHVVRPRCDGAGCAYKAYEACAACGGKRLDCGADYSEHAARGIDEGQVALLYRPQGFGRSGVAGEDYEVAALVEQMPYGLEREAVYEVERACAVGRACVVAEVEEVGVGDDPPQFAQYSEASVARVEYSDHYNSYNNKSRVWDF